MTSSRSNKRGAIALVVFAAGFLFATPHVAEAGRKRVVVLDFEGEKAEKFHDDMVKLVKKGDYTVVPTDTWNKKADELSATNSTDKDIRKVATKLKIDAVISGKIEKRRDDYLIHLKLRAGSTGQVKKPVEAKSSEAHIDGQAKTDIKDELVDAISGIESAKVASGDGDGDAATGDGDGEKKHEHVTKKHGDGDVAVVTDDGDGEKKHEHVTKKHGDGDGDGSAETADTGNTGNKHKGFSKHNGDGDEVGGSKVASADTDVKKKPETSDADGDTEKKPKKTKKNKNVAHKDPDDSGGGGGGGSEEGTSETEITSAGRIEKLDPSLYMAPGFRVMDVDAGLSFVDRKLAFKFTSGLENAPPGYKGVPVAGAHVDGVLYPMSLGHQNTGPLVNLGVTFNFDRVLHVSSQVNFIDDSGAEAHANLATTSESYEIGLIYRYPIKKSPTAPVATGELRFQQQEFLIAQTIPGTAMTSSDIPNVTYTMITPALGIKFPVTTKITVSANGGIDLISSAGGINSINEYGTGKTLGFEGGAAVDYMVKKDIFVRAAFRAEKINMTFQGQGALTMRGGDTTVDVQGATDTYFGGSVTVGYVY